MANLPLPHVFEPASPASDDAPPPLLLLHGTGGGEHDLLDLGRALSPGSALLSPRGPVSERGAARFFARLAEGVFDPAEVQQRTHQLADFIDAAARAYQLDQTRLLAIGFSNGANVAATLLQLRPDAIGGAVLFRAMVVLDRPAEPETLRSHRVLMVNGAQDPIVPPVHPPRLRQLLEAGGADVTAHVLPASHSLTSHDVGLARDWFARRR